MKAVLLSVQPKWCELIASDKKTIEVRKTRPKLETPFKVYIYCTQDKKFNFCTDDGEQYTHIGNGKVIGEFVCDEITYLGNVSTDPWCTLIGNVHEWHKQLVTKYACLTEKELLKYGGKYAWHISNLIIYEKPKELCELSRHDDTYDNVFGWMFEDRAKNIPITRPPQSWCYVEL